MLKFQTLAFSLVSNGITIKIELMMNQRDEKSPERSYKWPWFLLVAVLLFVALTILWMSYAVHREKQERDFSAPIPAGAK